jgi:probable HAF family extracellular repeat protein
MNLFRSLLLRKSRGPSRPPGRRGLPRLEALEDRCVPSYTVTLLGTLGGADSIAYAINASGQVVGQADLASGQSHAFLADGGTLQDLGTLGGDNSAARALNSSGTVVGWSNDSSDPTHQVTFILDSTGLRPLGLEGIAYGINDSGAAVGQTASGQGFLIAGHDPVLFTNPDGRSRASAINASGVVAGWDETDHDSLFGIYRQGDAWTNLNGTKTDLGVIPFPGHPQHSEAYAINASGQVVGRSGIYAYGGDNPGWLVSHAFLYQPGSGIRDLGTLPGGGADTVAYGINDKVVTPEGFRGPFFKQNSGPKPRQESRWSHHQ